MSFTPGEMLRRAANAASSTVSTVASVATGGTRRRSAASVDGASIQYEMLQHAKEKSTLPIKSTPSKDALTTSHLSIRNGYLLKRNEQGSWQRRYVCVVPHFFMYYYDSDTSDTPRGVIDLELYDQLSKEDNILKLSTSDEEKLRSYYFEDEDSDYLNEWITCLQRERYHAVCDERNAYQQMQLEMSGALDSASSNEKFAEKEKEELEAELRAANKSSAEGQAILQSMLVIVGITEEEMAKLTDLGKIGQALKTGILQTKARLERKIEENILTAQTSDTLHDQEIQSLAAQIQAEIQARKALEDSILNERQKGEAREQEALSQMQNVNMEVQMALAAKQSAEQKAATLSDQKKILVKEVKQLRKKLEEMNESMEVLRLANERLSGAVMMQPDGSVGTGPAAVGAGGSSSAEEATPGSASSGGLLSPLQAGGDDEQRGGSGAHSPMFFSSTPSDGGSASKLLDDVVGVFDRFSSNNSSTKEGSSGGASTAAANDSQALVGHSPLVPSSLRSSIFGGLLGSSPEQSDGVTVDSSSPARNRRPSYNHNINIHEIHSEDDEEHNIDGKNPNGIAAAAAESDGVADIDAANTDVGAEAATATGTGVAGGATPPVTAKTSIPGFSSSPASDGVAYGRGGSRNRRSSLSALTSMFGSVSGSDGSAPSGGGLLNDGNLDGGVAATSASDGIGKPPIAKGDSTKASFFSSAFSFGKDSAGQQVAEDAPGRIPSAQRLRCLRCDGTVEGPKYSTCKCDVPALNKEDLVDASGTTDKASEGETSGMSGMFKSAKRGSMMAFSGLLGSKKEGNTPASTDSGNGSFNTSINPLSDPAVPETSAEAATAANTANLNLPTTHAPADSSTL